MPKSNRPKAPRLKPPGAGDGYEVGYAKPPETTRFKAGQSGNPKGRPKGSKNKKPRLNDERFKEIILAEAYRTIKVSDGDKKVTIPMAQAVVRALAVNAAKGQHRAQHLFAELVSSTERANKALHDEYLKALIEYKTDWEKTLERRKALGIVAPDPLPHPDDIIIDFKTGEAHIHGPMSKEEKVAWDSLRKRIDDSDDEIRELQRLAEEPESAHHRQLIESDIQFETRLRDMLRGRSGIGRIKEESHATSNYTWRRKRPSMVYVAFVAWPQPPMPSASQIVQALVRYRIVYFPIA